MWGAVSCADWDSCEYFISVRRESNHQHKIIIVEALGPKKQLTSAISLIMLHDESVSELSWNQANIIVNLFIYILFGPEGCGEETLVY